VDLAWNWNKKVGGKTFRKGVPTTCPRVFCQTKNRPDSPPKGQFSLPLERLQAQRQAPLSPRPNALRRALSCRQSFYCLLSPEMVRPLAHHVLMRASDDCLPRVYRLSMCPHEWLRVSSHHFHSEFFHVSFLSGGCLAR
jgi:hypothetical protein